jgi:hypothetical protein
MIKEKPPKNRVYVQCSDTERRVKGVIISKIDAEMEVELPTGFVLHMRRKNRRSPFVMRMGQLEFYSDGKEIA